MDPPGSTPLILQVGLAVDEEASSEAGAVCAAAAGLLDQLFPAVLAALRTGNDEIAAAAVPFLLSYVTRLKAVQVCCLATAGVQDSLCGHACWGVVYVWARGCTHHMMHAAYCHAMHSMCRRHNHICSTLCTSGAAGVRTHCTARTLRHAAAPAWDLLHWFAGCMAAR